MGDIIGCTLRLRLFIDHKSLSTAQYVYCSSLQSNRGYVIAQCAEKIVVCMLVLGTGGDG